MNIKTHRLLAVCALCAAALTLAAPMPAAADDLVDSLPADAFFYAGVNTAVLEESQTFTAKLIGEERLEALTDDVLDWVSGLVGMDMHILPQIEKLDASTREWMGEEIGFVLSTGVIGEQPHGALLIEVKSAKKAEKEFPKLLDELKGMTAELLGTTQPGNMMGAPSDEAAEVAKIVEDFEFEFETSKHGGVNVHAMAIEDGESVYWAATDAALVLAADRDYVHALIDGAKDSGLAPLYDAKVADDTAMFGLLDARKLFTALDAAGQMGMEPEMRAEFDAIDAASLVYAIDGMVEDVVVAVSLDPAKVANTQYLSLITSFPPSTHDVDLVLNRESTSFSLTLNNLDRYLQLMQGMMGADLQAAEADFLESTGVSLIELMNSVGGEAGVALDDFALNMEGLMAAMMGGESETAPADLSTMLVVQINDAGPITALMDVGVEQSKQDPNVNVEKVDGGWLMTLSGPMQQIPLSFATADGMLGVGFGLSPDAVRARLNDKGGEKNAMSTNLKLGADMAAMAEILSNMLGQFEVTPWFGMAEGALDEEGVDYYLWKDILYHSYRAAGDVAVGLSVTPGEIALMSHQVGDAEALKAIPFEKMVEALKAMVEKGIEEEKAKYQDSAAE